jgi:tRNA(fMet)-specific endonuclease VapC
MVCLDTSVIIDLLDGNARVKAAVDRYLQNAQAAATSITEYELCKHKNELKRETAILMLDDMEIYNFDREAAKEASNIFNTLRAKGRLINENDILIAAIALSRNEILITSDKDFNEIGNSKIIVV